MRPACKDVVLAESEYTEVVETNHYFPRDDVKMEYLTKSDTQYTCPWKGDATYYHIDIGNEHMEDGAWSYENPKEAAKQIKGHICFDKKLVTG